MLALPAPLLLASTSKYRKAQLARLGLPFACVAPPYDEQPVAGLDAASLVIHHARQKAAAVASLPDASGAWVLAADQGVVLGEGSDAVLLGKPHTAERAVEQLLLLAGRWHGLHTHVVLHLPDGRQFEHTEVVRMQVRALTRGEAEAYVALDQPLDCAGSYKIEAGGPWVLQACEGRDPTAIEGLPLLAVTALLRAAVAGARR
jgi:septum formation protein